MFTVANEDIYDVLEEMHEAGVCRAPVVEDDGSVSGIVTLDDFVVLLASEFGEVSGIIQSESPLY